VLRKIIYISLSLILFNNPVNTSVHSLKDEVRLVEFQHKLDTRKIKSKSSPELLNAVGKLGYRRSKINSGSKIKRNLKLDCTANLISQNDKKDSNIILTAKHCLFEGIRQYTWTSSTNSGEKITRRAKVVYQDKEEDWAILKLTKKIDYKDVNPLIVDKEKFKNANFEKEQASAFTVAGFSVDWLGSYGKHLTYEENPSFLCIGDGKNRMGEIGSITYQGDSGGAIIYEDDNESKYLVGIMSHIKNNDSLFKSAKGSLGNISGYFISFVDYDMFFSVLRKYI
jgi:hypothetical protein